MLTTINHKAFLDLENGLATRVKTGWRSLWKPLAKQLTEAISDKDWGRADKIVDTLNTNKLVKQYARYAETIGMSALLLGASRLSTLTDSKVVKDPPARQLRNAVTQWGFQVARNAPQILRRKLHLQLAAIEHKTEQARHVIQKDDSTLEQDAADLVDSIESDGDASMSLASSLLVSRLSSFGFLAEALDQGIETYEISAILDDHTCPVCEALDGQIFSVRDGITLAYSIMDAEDADSLKSIAPWPSQSKDSVQQINDADAQDLVDSGLALPPYHGFCRCIAIPVDSQQDQQSETADDVQSIAADMPEVSLGALAAILGIAGGTLLFPATDHKGNDLVGEVEDDGGDAEQKVYDDSGDEILDSNDNPLIENDPLVDSDGNLVMVNEDGQPVLDDNGKLLVMIDGSVIDSDGNELQLDEDGNLKLDDLDRPIPKDLTNAN